MASTTNVDGRTEAPPRSSNRHPVFDDRSVAAFIGLALGDAFGKPLEFESGERVRHLPVEIVVDERDEGSRVLCGAYA